MILVGQFDSPFVRRVAIALGSYALPFEHRPWSVWAQADELAQLNPLRRVPTLVLDDGEVLTDSAAILDHLDEQVGEARAMLPARGPSRRHGLRIMALGTGLADKAVSLFYEHVLHRDHASAEWLARCEAQIGDVLVALERERAVATRYWLGEALSHADTTVACTLRFLLEAHPGSFDLAPFPALAAHSSHCEALPVFQAHQQPFTVSLPK